jgi:hypothetical protein
MPAQQAAPAADAVVSIEKVVDADQYMRQGQAQVGVILQLPAMMML